MYVLTIVLSIECTIEIELHSHKPNFTIHHAYNYKSIHIQIVNISVNVCDIQGTNVSYQTHLVLKVKLQCSRCQIC